MFCSNFPIFAAWMFLRRNNDTKIWLLFALRIPSLRYLCANICGDIVLRKYRTCVFVNGCFWHGHDGCKYFRLPKTNTDFWEKKINRNKERDKEEQRQLAKMGWHCITVWECELKPKVRDKTLESLAYTLNHIYLEDRSVKYKLPKEEDIQIAAEPKLFM